MIFIGVAPDPVAYRQFQDHRIELATETGNLQGWHLRNNNSQSTISILYFGGNAEDVVSSLEILSAIGAKEVFAFNYRGYGLSNGKPSQHALYTDALAIYDHLIENQAHSEKMLIVGRSLGSAVATYLVSQRETMATILITPLNSMLAMANKLFPYIPNRFLLRHRFDVVNLAPGINTPVHMFIAGNDEIIPSDYSKELYRLWLGDKNHTFIETADHNTITDYPEFLDHSRKFLQHIETRSTE